MTNLTTGKRITRTDRMTRGINAMMVDSYLTKGDTDVTQWELISDTTSLELNKSILEYDAWD